MIATPQAQGEIIKRERDTIGSFSGFYVPWKGWINYARHLWFLCIILGTENNLLNTNNTHKPVLNTNNTHKAVQLHLLVSTLCHPYLYHFFFSGCSFVHFIFIIIIVHPWNMVPKGCSEWNVVLWLIKDPHSSPSLSHSQKFLCFIAASSFLYLDVPPFFCPQIFKHFRGRGGGGGEQWERGSPSPSLACYVPATHKITSLQITF